MSAQVVLKLQGPLDHLRLVWQTGETLLENMALDADAEATRYNVLLALQEMVTNVLRHAYDHNCDNPIEVAFTLDAHGLSVQLRDRGPWFDPLAHDTSDLEDFDGMPTETGGYGIFIAKMVMDRVHYHRDGDWNVLTMTKLARSVANVATD